MRRQPLSEAVFEDFIDVVGGGGDVGDDDDGGEEILADVIVQHLNVQPLKLKCFFSGTTTLTTSQNVYGGG